MRHPYNRRVKNVSDKLRAIIHAALNAPTPGAPRIVDSMFEVGTDGTGDQAVTVTVFLDESTTEKEWTSEHLEPIEDRVSEAIHNSDLGLWPYVRFARKSDLRQAG